MNIPRIEPGLQGSATRLVSAADLATALGSGTVEVFGTPAMIALMEAAAVEALANVLPPELTSVGMQLQIDHVAATPSGARVTATATVSEVDGRRITFEVHAADEVETIGHGRHRRVIVEREKFQQRAQAKSGT